MMNLNCTFDEFESLFVKERDYKKLTKLIEPLLENWKFKNKDNIFWDKIFKKISQIIDKFYKSHFSFCKQEKEFLIDEKDLLRNLFKFIQRIYFFLKCDIPGIRNVIFFTFSKDNDVSIQAFKIAALTRITDVYLEVSEKLNKALIDFINAEELIIQTSEHEIKKFKPTDLNYSIFVFPHLEKDIFYFIKKVYAFLLFKSSIEKDSMNRKKLLEFCEGLIKNLKSFINEKLANEYDEAKFCLDRLILFLINLKVEESEILRFLEVESKNDYVMKVLNYSKNTKFEEILSLSILEKILIHAGGQISLRLISNKGNPDFDYEYMNIVYTRLIDCDFGSHVLDFDEYRGIIEKLENYTIEEDYNVLRITFQIINMIYFNQQNSLDLIELGTFLLKLSNILDIDKPVLSSCCIRTICFLVNNETQEIKRILNRGEFLKLMEPGFWKIGVFGAMCKLFRILYSDEDYRKKVVEEKIFKEFLKTSFKDNNEILEEVDILEYDLIIDSCPEFVSEILEFQYEYLNSIINKNENEIISLINFFSVFRNSRKNNKQMEKFLFENVELILKALDKIIVSGIPNYDRFYYAFFNLVSSYSGLFQLPEIPIYHFLQRIVELLPKIKDIMDDNVLSLLENYLFTICNSFAGLDYDEFLKGNMKFFNIIFNSVMNLIPKLFNVRHLFEFRIETSGDLSKIIAYHTNINGNFNNLLTALWNELMYLLCVSLKWDEIINGKISRFFLEQIYKKLPDNDFKYYLLLYKETNIPGGEPGDFIASILSWNPEIEYIKPREESKNEYTKFMAEFTTKWIVSTEFDYLFYHFDILKYYLIWIADNDILNANLPFLTPDILYDTLDNLNLPKEYLEDLKLYDESIIRALINGPRGYEEMALKVINNLIIPITEFSPEFHDEIVNFYCKYFNFNAIISYKRVLENMDFINRLLKTQNFVNLIHYEILDASLYFVNNIFIDSKAYLELYIFVLRSLTYCKVEDNRDIAEKINLDSELLIENQVLYKEMKINITNIPKYLKRVMKSKSIKKKDKFLCCIEVLKYLSGNLTILHSKFYKQILKFAYKCIEEINGEGTNILIKCLIHHLLEGPHDAMEKMNIFDGHLITYNNFIDSGKILGYANINGLKARFERKLRDLPYNAESRYNEFSYVLELVQKKLFKKLLKIGLEKDNVLNIVTEILINNVRYAKYITIEYIRKIIDKKVIELSSDVGIDFLVACIKSDNIVLQNVSFYCVKEAITNCDRSKLYTFIYLLIRSVEHIEVEYSENEIYVASTKMNELSEKYIKEGMINAIIEKLIYCKECDLKLENNNNSIVRENLIKNRLNLNWSNYDNKIAYIYDFISSVYKNFYVDSVNKDYDSRIELTPYGDYYVKPNHDLSQISQIRYYDILSEDYEEPYEFLEERNYKRKMNLSDCFSRLYLSYSLYAYEYSNHSETVKFDKLLANHFYSEYGIYDLKAKFHPVEINKSWEDKEFTNLSEIQNYEIEESLNKIGFVNGEIPDFEINEVSNDELDSVIKKWNEKRIRSNELYIGINIDFIKKCNKTQKHAFLKAEEELITFYTYDCKPRGIITKKYVESKYYDINFVNTVKGFDLQKYFIDRVKYSTVNDIENHPTPDIFPKIYWFKQSSAIYCEEVIARMHAFNFIKKKVNCIREKDGNYGLDSDDFINLIDNFCHKSYFWHSKISNFFKIISANKEFGSQILKITKNLVFKTCSSDKIDLTEIRNILEIYFSTNTNNENRSKSDIYFTRLLFLLSRYPELYDITVPHFVKNYYREDLYTNYPLFDKTYNINTDLTNIPETEIHRMLIWNFKELLKNKVYSKDLINLFKCNLYNHLLEFIAICLEDQEVLSNSLNVIYELSKYAYEKVNEESQVYQKRLKEKFDLPNTDISNVNFKILYDKGIFTDYESMCPVYPGISKALNLLTNTPTVNNMILFDVLEGFINLFPTFPIINRKSDCIGQFSNLRSKFEIEMIKDRDFCNRIFRTDSRLSSFLLKFNIISFSNKLRYFKDQLQWLNLDFPHKMIFNINRNHVVENTYDSIINLDIKDFKSGKIMIRFEGESGQDAGGLTKEWLELLAKGVTNQDLGLFTYSSDKHTTFLPYSGSNIEKDHLQYFKFIGRVIGKAIIEGYNFPINLDKTVYKFILNKKCDLQDLNFGDPQFYNSLVWMRDNSIKDILHLTFTYENTLLGELKVEDLKLNGRNIQVSDENKNEYIDLIIQKKFINNIHSQLKALKDGILEIIDEELINIFDEKELELLICGVPEINIEDWKMNTIYYDYNKNSKVIIWFWEAVYEFNTHERAKLMHFCTGSSRVPYGGFNDGIQKFKIQKITGKRLPTAHTCFNQLDLPEYETYEELRRNIIYAINEGHGTYGFA